MDCAPEYSGEPYFLPYVEAFGRLAKERGWKGSGIRSGEEFALLWDQRSRDFIGRKVPALEISREEEERMLRMLSEFGDWLKSFPEAEEN